MSSGHSRHEAIAENITHGRMDQNSEYPGNMREYFFSRK